MATGPIFDNIKGDGNSGTTYKLKGDAFGFDLQIGGALKPNLILHATGQNKTLVGPKINGERMENKHSFQENFYGVGVTEYTNENFFITGNIGIGHFFRQNN